MERAVLMKEKIGVVYSIAGDNRPIPGCTVSKETYNQGDDYISHFSMAADTDISAEIYGYHKMLIVADGVLTVYAPGVNNEWTFQHGEMIITPINTPVGTHTKTDTVYTEISMGRTLTMNSAIHAGEAFRLADLVPYQEGKIVNMDVAHNDKMKFVIMAFDAGTGLAEHAAPGEALIFALDGKGVIGYEGKAYPIQAGENFKFAAGGKHWVKADGRFKMALLMILEG